MLLLLYQPSNPDVGIERLAEPQAACLLHMGPLARTLKLNSSRLYDQLLFLQSIGYLQKVDVNFKWGRVLVVPTPPCGWSQQKV